MLNVVKLPTKQCGKCKQIKYLKEFWRNKSHKDGRYTICRPCCTIYHKQRRERHSTSILSYFRLHYCRLKARAKKKALEFTISIDDLIEVFVMQQGLCSVTKRKLNYQMNGGRPLDRVSVDRIDNTKGYIKNNIQLVIDAVNTMKGTLSMNELFDICENILLTNRPEKIKK